MLPTALPNIFMRINGAGGEGGEGAGAGPGRTETSLKIRTKNSDCKDNVRGRSTLQSSAHFYWLSSASNKFSHI